MRLLRFQMIGSVAVNGIFSHKWKHYGLKGGILDCWGNFIFLFIILLYPIKV